MSKTSKRYVSLLLAFVMMFTTMFTSVSLAEAESKDFSKTPDIAFRFDGLNEGTTSSSSILVGKSEGNIFTSSTALNATITTGASIVTDSSTKAIEITGTSNESEKSIRINVTKGNAAVTVYTSTSGEAVKLQLKPVGGETNATEKTVRSVEGKSPKVFYVKNPGEYYLGFDTAAEGNTATETKSKVYGIDVDYNKQEADFTVKLKDNATVAVKGDTITPSDGITKKEVTTSGSATVITLTVDKLSDFTGSTPELVIPDSGYQNAIAISGYLNNQFTITQKADTIENSSDVKVNRLIKEYIFVLEEKSSEPEPSDKFEGTISINNKYKLEVSESGFKFVDGDSTFDADTASSPSIIKLPSSYKDIVSAWNENSFSPSEGFSLKYNSQQKILEITKANVTKSVQFVVEGEQPATGLKITSKYFDIVVSDTEIQLQDKDGNNIGGPIGIDNSIATVDIAPKYGFFSWKDGDFGTSSSAHSIKFNRDAETKAVSLQVTENPDKVVLTINFKDIPITLKSSVKAEDVANLEKDSTFIATFEVDGNTGFNNATFDIIYPEGIVKPVEFGTTDNIDDTKWLQKNEGAFITKDIVNKQVSSAKDGKLRIAGIDANFAEGTEALNEVIGNGTLLQVKFQVVADTKGNYEIGSSAIEGTTRIFNFKPSSEADVVNEIRTIIENNAKFSLNGTEEPDVPGKETPSFKVKGGTDVIVVGVTGDTESDITATGKNSAKFEDITFDSATSTATIKIEAKYFDDNINNADLSFTYEGNAKTVNYNKATNTITVAYGNEQTYTIKLERKDGGDTPGPDEKLNLTVTIGNLDIKIVSGSSIQLVENGTNVGTPIEITNSTADVTIPGKYGISSWKDGDFKLDNNKYTVSYDENTKTLTIKEGTETKLTIKFNETVITLDVELPTNISDLKADGTFIATFKISGNTGFNNATFNVVYPEGIVKPVKFADTDNINDGEWLQGNEGAFISKILVDQQVDLAVNGKLTLANLDANMSNSPELFEVTDNGTFFQVKFQVVKTSKEEQQITVQAVDGSDRIFNFKPDGSSVENMLKSVINGAKFTFKDSEEPDVPGKETPSFKVKGGTDVIVVGVTGDTESDITATGKNSAKFEDITFDSATSTATIKIEAKYFDDNINNADLSFTYEGNAKTAAYDKATNTITVTYGNDQTYVIKLVRKDGGDTPDPEPETGLKLKVSAGNFGINISGSSIQLTFNGENVGDEITFSGSTVDITIPGKYGINSWNANSFVPSDSKYTVEYNEGTKVLTIKENGETKLTINFTESAINFTASTVDTSTLTNGDTFLVTFAIDGNTGFNNLTFDITYNNEAIKPVAFDATEDAEIENSWIQASNPAEPGAFITKEYIESQITENNGKIRIANVDWNIAADNEALYEITEDGTLLQVRFEVIDASKTSKVDMVGTGTDNRIFNYAPDSSSDLNNMVKADVTPIEELAFNGTEPTPTPTEGKVTVTPVGAKLEGEGEDQKAAYVYKEDGTFDVDFNIESNPGINSYKFTVTYNSKSVAPVLDNFNSTVEGGYAYYTDAEGNKQLMVTASNITSPEDGKLVISGTLPEGFEAKDGNKLFKLTFTTLGNEHKKVSGEEIGNPELTFTVDEVKGAAAAERTLTVDDITPIRIHPMTGDINADDTVSVIDAATIINYLADKINNKLIDEYQEYLADIDGKNGVAISDAAAIINYLADRINNPLPDKD